MADVHPELQVELGKERMGRALDRIEQAKRLLDAATSDLLGVVGADELFHESTSLFDELSVLVRKVGKRHGELAKEGGPRVDEFTMRNELQRRVGKQEP